MSSSPSIEWVLDKIADLASGPSEDDAAFGVLLTLVGSLDPVPETATLQPVASRIRKLRLAQVLDHPSDLRLGAVRLLAALDGPSLPTFQPEAAGPAAVEVPDPAASSEPAPSSAREEGTASVPALAPQASAPVPAPAPPLPKAVPPEEAGVAPSSEEAGVVPSSEEVGVNPQPAEIGVTPPQRFRRARGRVVLSFPHPGEEADTGRENGA